MPRISRRDLIASGLALSTSSLSAGGSLAIMSAVLRPKAERARKVRYEPGEIEAYWQNEDDWLSTVEFLPNDDPEGRLFAAHIVGYLFGYRSLKIRRVVRTFPYATSPPNSAVARKSVGCASP
ncbi:MAG: hypothetical protein ACXWNQ_06575 [Anaerolineales bacterium]